MIKGERVTLIAANSLLEELTLKWINQPELREYTNSRFPVNPFEHKKWFENKVLDKSLKMYGIVDNTSNQIIGVVGLNEYDPYNRTAYPYIYIGETNNQLKGLGTESFQLFLKFLKNQMNVHRVYGFLYEYNTASLGMLKKCGYAVEGSMKSHWYSNGKYHDVVVVGCLL